MNPCVVCGRPVPLENDGLLLYVLSLVGRGKSGEAVWMTLTADSRHLLPERDCEGTPLLAQYLEGQPRDTNPENPPYIPQLEPLMRAAYEKMLGWDGDKLGEFLSRASVELPVTSLN